MGNKTCFHPRVILTEDTALHFKSSNLQRDVIPIIDHWKKQGADLAFTLQGYSNIFDVVVDLEKQFNVFDTDRDGRVDAHEVLMVYILLSQGDMEEKIDIVFSIFDFASSRSLQGTICFDEAMIMMNSAVRGLLKVCQLEIEIPDDEIFFHCKSLFDMHRLQHTARLKKKQFKEWTANDPSPRSFVQLFHDSQGLPDIFAQVQKRNLDQGLVFQMLCYGSPDVDPISLRENKDFERVLGDPSEVELDVLVELMHIGSSNGRVTTDRYHTVLRPWNIFNECDLDGSKSLDEKEMEILLWIQLRHKPVREFVSEFCKSIDSNDDGEISRHEWVQAIVAGRRVQLTKRIEDGGNESGAADGDDVDQMSRLQSVHQRLDAGKAPPGDLNRASPTGMGAAPDPLNEAKKENLFRQMVSAA